VTQVLVAVVRYYGGTKLGVGGLIQAYRTAAKLALEDAEIVEKEILARYQVSCTYEQLPVLMKEIKMQQMDITHQVLDLHCALEVTMKVELCADWEAQLMFLKINYKRLE
jgi:putative IMPACT (imprinted ancient) family translation regulator